MTSQNRLRNFVFTINNPTITPDQLWDALQPLAKYLIFQLEQGTNGTPHFQGYCELHRRTRFTKVKTIIPTAHIEPRRGTQEEAISYVRKDDTRVEGPFEYGDYTPQRPGARNDIAHFRDAIRAGKRKRELDDEFPTLVAKYPRYIDNVRSYGKKELRLNLRVELYWGDQGTGKTRKAWETSEDSYIIPVSDTLWFDGYDGQELVILDDFTGWMKLDHLLRILDIYPVQVAVKGGFTWFTPSKIIITSNKHYSEWYDFNKHGKVKLDALRRRLHRVEHHLPNSSCPIVEPAIEDEHQEPVDSLGLDFHIAAAEQLD